MGIQERKEREKQEMRELILRTAKQVFIEEGYEKTSIRTIADRIEYSPATIYLYYKDKDQLLFAIHELGFDALIESFRSLQEIVDPLERLRQLGYQYVQFAIDNPEMYDLMFISYSPMNALEKAPEGSTWDCGHESFRTLCVIIQENMEQGLIRTNDLYVTALSVWSFVHGLASLHIRNRLKLFPESLNTQYLINQSLDLLITSLKV